MTTQLARCFERRGMTLVRLRWLSVILVLGHVRGIQYDVCNDIPTSFSPMCDLGKSYTLDDYQGKQYFRCSIKKCNTQIMKDYDANLDTIEPFPEVTVNHLANFTCRYALPPVPFPTPSGAPTLLHE